MVLQHTHISVAGPSLICACIASWHAAGARLARARRMIAQEPWPCPAHFFCTAPPSSWPTAAGTVLCVTSSVGQLPLHASRPHAACTTKNTCVNDMAVISPVVCGAMRGGRGLYHQEGQDGLIMTLQARPTQAVTAVRACTKTQGARTHAALHRLHTLQARTHRLCTALSRRPMQPMQPVQHENWRSLELQVADASCSYPYIRSTCLTVP